MSTEVPPTLSVTEPTQLPAGTINVSAGDPTSCRVVIQEMVKGLRLQQTQTGRQSRERALAITKLQEAEMWLFEAMAVEG